jgi:glycosyltransferase involved in cell wall biosynthesis
MEVIPNAFDLQSFKPDPYAKSSVRTELGAQAGAFLIGMAARFHVLKDHRNFMEAAARLHSRFPEVHFVLFGRGVSSENAELNQWAAAAGIRSRCHLLGERRDVARLFSAMDIVASSSLSEAFPLAIGEAMACGTPCVVTNVGDSGLLIDTTGEVVAPGDPNALAEAWGRLIEAGPEERCRLGMAARRRVQRHFSLATAVERYQAIYAQLAGKEQPDVL